MRLTLALLAVLAAQTAPEEAKAASCRDDSFEGISFTLCEVGADEDLQLFHQGADGTLGSFRAINALLEAKGQELGFAMNAGMYHRDLAPVGLFVADGVESAPLVTREGPGNFGLLPNGVFCWGAPNAGYRVIESRRFKEEAPDCRFATQSGPMLVIEGALHPRFLPDSDSFNIRNGVGVTKDGSTAYFVVSNDKVTFHQFGRYFRDHLGLPNALYFDGSISRLYAPQLGRHDGGFPMGPIVGTVVPKG